MYDKLPLEITILKDKRVPFNLLKISKKIVFDIWIYEVQLKTFRHKI